MKRYFVASGTLTLAEFDTAEELNTWYDAQDTEHRYFCRLYDTVKHIDILGSAYMWFKPEERWTDDSHKERMNKIISYQLYGGSTQLLTGLVVTMKEIKSLKKGARLESEGIKTDSYTGVKYAIFHNPIITRLNNGAYDFGQRYFVEVKCK